MNKLFLAVFLILHTSFAYAGEKFDSLKKEIEDYLVEQDKMPDKIIKYGDSNGNIALTILSPKKVVDVLDEISQEKDYPSKLWLLTQRYNPIGHNYGNAFEQSPGQYDAEYLDYFEVFFWLMVANTKQLQKANYDSVKDENVKAMIQNNLKKAIEFPTYLLGVLDKQIKNKQFREDHTEKAIAQLKYLREVQSQRISASN